MNLPAYPKYKDSGVAWLGMVPEGWEVKRLKDITTMQCGYAFKSEIFTDEGIPLVRMSNLKRGNLDLNDAVRIPFNEVLDAFLLEENDLLLGLSGSLGETGSLGNFAIVKNTDIPSLLNQRVGRFILSTNIMARFLIMVLQTELFYRPIELNSTGTAQFNVSPEAVGETTIPLPPLPEQQAIAAFLERETAQIDALVEKQRRMLDLLKEKRTALISHAVTKGLNPDAKLKDSGVAWLGMVPEGWEVKRLKFITNMQCGYAFKSEIFADEGIPVVRMSNLKRGSLDLDDAVKIPFDEALNAFLLEENDLLLGLSGSLGETGSLGNFAIVKKGDIPSLLNQRVGRFILSTNIMARFLVMVLQTELFSRPIELSSTGTAQFNVSPEAVGETTIPLPPLSEQQTIVTFLDRETAKIDTLATRIEDMITKLQEYRTALITAAVTGKVDVRSL